MINQKPLTGLDKQCSKCAQIRDTSLYNKCSRNRPGLDSWCKLCKADMSRKYYRDNIVVQRTKAREYGRANKEGIYNRKLKDPRVFLWICAKPRAKKKGLVFNLKPSDIEVPEFCPVLRIKLEFAKGVANDFSPTVDRNIPDLGYISSNISVISKRANRLKGDGTVEELRSIANWLDKTLKGEK